MQAGPFAEQPATLEHLGDLGRARVLVDMHGLEVSISTANDLFSWLKARSVTLEPPLPAPIHLQLTPPVPFPRGHRTKAEMEPALALRSKRMTLQADPSWPRNPRRGAAVGRAWLKVEKE